MKASASLRTVAMIASIAVFIAGAAFAQVPVADALRKCQGNRDR